MRSKLEAEVCAILNDLGLAHAHTPRHFEVRLDGNRMAAYSPDIVVRGRGREGKTVVFETLESPRDPDVEKVAAFRKQYGQEFYVIVVAHDDVLARIEEQCYDESSTPEAMQSFLGRMVD